MSKKRLVIQGFFIFLFLVIFSIGVSQSALAADVTAPVVTLNPLAPDPTNDTTPTLYGTAADASSTIVTVEYDIDSSGVWSACSPTDSLFDELSEDYSCTPGSPIATGTHTMSVQATDSSTNTSVPVTDTFYIDTSVPAITINALSPDPTTDNAPVFTGSSSDAFVNIASVKYKIDSGSWQDCSATDGSFNSLNEDYTCTVGSLIDGLHTVYVKVTDVAGNESDGATSDSFTIDTNPPTVLLTSLSPDPTSNDQPTFSGTATDATTNIQGVEFRIYDGATTTAWAACTPDDGTFDSLSEAYTCSPGHLDDNVGAGEYIIYVRASDVVDNASSGAVHDHFVVDTIAPAGLLVNYPTAAGIYLRGGSNINIEWDTPTDLHLGFNPIKIEYSVSGNFDDTALVVNNLSAAGPYSWTVAMLNSSTTKMRITATDQAGNAATSTSINPFTVDSTAPPTITIQSFVNDLTSTSTPTFMATATDDRLNITEAKYNIDGGSWISCTATDGVFNSITEGLTCGPVAALLDGAHRVYVKAKDAVGNWSGDTAHYYDFEADTTPPTVDAGTIAGTIYIPTAPGATASDNIDTAGELTYLWSSVSGPGIITFSNANILNPNLSANTSGTYVARLTVTDRSENSDNDTVSFDWSTDVIVTSATASPDPAKNGTVTVTVVFNKTMDTGVDPTVNITGITGAPITVTKSTYSGDTWTGTFSLTDNNEDKTATISVADAKDIAGNTMAANPTAGTFAVDTVSPALAFSNDVEVGPVSSDTINITVTETHPNTSDYGFSDDSTCDGTDTYPNSFTPSTPFTISSAANNGKWICARAVDTAGNISYLASANDLNIDTGLPGVTSATASPDPAKNGTVTVTVVFNKTMDTGVDPTVNITGITGAPI
ncbi:MAG: Ig-like domain-containing protein, partial [Patescibacteria group bacterium]